MNLYNLSINRLTVVIFLLFSTIFSSNLEAENWDVEIMRAVHTNRNPALDKVMQGISNSVVFVVPAIPIGLFAAGISTENEAKRKDLIGNSLQIGSSVAISGLTAYCIKAIIKRDRPFVNYDFIENIGKENGYSMPSIHTAFAFSLATSLSLQYPKWYIILPSYLWASTVAYSRMHLGVHYLSDLLIGAVVGAGISYATFYIEQEVMKQ